MPEQTLDELITSKLDELERIPFGNEQGRRLELHFIHTKDTHRELMERSFRDLAKRMGVDFVSRTPVVALEQFTIMSVKRNEDTAGLLVSLLNSFMVAYLTPETCDTAFRHLLGLEATRGQVGKMRGKRPSVH